jgi:hypothetical protein
VPQLPNDFIRRLKAPAYLIVAFLSVGSVVEVIAAGWPLRLHDINWRVGVLNTAAGATGTELLALLILIVVAQVAYSRAAMWTAFGYSLLVALGYMAVFGLFALDCLQLRGRVPAAELPRFDVTVAWALIRFAFADLVSLWVAACALTGARMLQRETTRDASDRRTALIVGNPGATAPDARLDRRQTPRQGLKVGS